MSGNITLKGNLLFRNSEDVDSGKIDLDANNDLKIINNNNSKSVIVSTNNSSGAETERIKIGEELTIHTSIIPALNDTVDIGSAEKKIRDMYISDNSLWIGDEHKLSVSGGKMKIRKRKTSSVPDVIATAGGTIESAKTFAGVGNISDIKLVHWEGYLQQLTGDNTKKVSDIFRDNSNDYEEESTSNWVDSGTNVLFNENAGNVGIGTNNPGTNKLHVEGDINFSGNLKQNGVKYGISVVGKLENGTAVDEDNISTIEFDNNTGFNLDNTITNKIKVSLGSHWKEFQINGQDTLIPSGEENIEFEAGSNIVLTTDTTSTPKKLTIAATPNNDWENTYLINPPPVPTNSSSSKDRDKIKLNWTNPARIIAGFVNHLLPNVITIKIDYKLSSQEWNQAQTITVNNTNVNSIELYVEGSGNTVSGNTYKFYTITSQTNYDFRVYNENYNTTTKNYIEFLTLATSSVGTPDAPFDIQVGGITITNVTFTWTEPADKDTTTAGVNSTPAIDNYKIIYWATNTNRYGGILHYNGYNNKNTVYSTNNTQNITLKPGHTYKFKVIAKNTQNSNYGYWGKPVGWSSSAGDTNTDSGDGENLRFVTANTLSPNTPNTLATSDCNTIANLTNLTIDGTSNISGKFLNGTVSNYVILDSNKFSSKNVETSLSNSIRIINTRGNTSNDTGKLFSFGGLDSETNRFPSDSTSSITTKGFGNNINGTYNSNKISLIVSNDGDEYSGDNSGFWKTVNMKGVTNNTSTHYLPSVNLYTIQNKQILNSTDYLTNEVNFYVDSLNDVPIIGGVAIINATNNIQKISGVPTYQNNTTFTIQFNMKHLSHYFLRTDLKHASLVIKGNVDLSNTTNISKSGTTYYITDNINSYTNTSSETTLSFQGTSQIRQFKNITIQLSSASNIFSENVKVYVTGYNRKGTSSIVNNTYVNTSNSSTKNIRIDTKSISLTFGNDYGTQVKSGTGTYPSSVIGDAYSHNDSILSSKELQLYNGKFRLPSKQNYANYFFPSSYTDTIPDYTNIVDEMRYVTFKYTGILSESSKCTITFEDTEGTWNLNKDDPEISIHIKVFDAQDNEHNTVWMNANTSHSGGINQYNASLQHSASNGVTCLSTSGDYISTAIKKYCYIVTATTGKMYIRVGINSGSNKKFSRIRLQSDFV